MRSRRPGYLDLLPPCNAGCPAAENIPAWLAAIRDGQPEQAWRQLVADNPLPAIHGRVCCHPCEDVCNRAELDSAVSIHGVRAVPRRSGHETRLVEFRGMLSSVAGRLAYGRTGYLSAIEQATHAYAAR